MECKIYNTNEKMEINIIETQINLLQLPAELIIYMFSFLNARDLSNLNLVSKDIKLLSEDGQLWGNLIKKENLKISNNSSEQMSKKDSYKEWRIKDFWTLYFGSKEDVQLEVFVEKLYTYMGIQDQIPSKLSGDFKVSSHRNKRRKIAQDEVGYNILTKLACDLTCSSDDFVSKKAFTILRNVFGPLERNRQFLDRMKSFIQEHGAYFHAKTSRINLGENGQFLVQFSQNDNNAIELIYRNESYRMPIRNIKFNAKGSLIFSDGVNEGTLQELLTICRNKFLITHQSISGDYKTFSSDSYLYN